MATSFHTRPRRLLGPLPQQDHHLAVDAYLYAPEREQMLRHGLSRVGCRRGYATAASNKVVFVDGVRLPFAMSSTIYKDELAVDLQKLAFTVGGPWGVGPTGIMSTTSMRVSCGDDSTRE
jgi:hypothetical protein